MESLSKIVADMEELSAHREERIKWLEARIERLEDDLNLEKTWAEGEIDFWKECTHRAESELGELRRQTKRKQWWRHIIS